MRKLLTLALALGMLLAACGGGGGRALERYYDPQGAFSTDLPANNDVQVMQPQQDPNGTSLVSGVASDPPQASPSATGGFLGSNLATAAQQDQTLFRVFVVTADRYATAEELSLLQLSDSAADLKFQQPIDVDGERGLLVVADYAASDTTPGYSVASAFVVKGDLGYWIAAAFPEGDWGHQQNDFLQIVRSFRTTVPPGVPAAPLSNPNG